MKKKLWDQSSLLVAVKSSRNIGFYYNPLAYRSVQLHRIAIRLAKSGKVTMTRESPNRIMLTIDKDREVENA